MNSDFANATALPLVSVYMPTRNRASLMLRAARSVLAQDYPNIELIVVDDASSDETADITETLALDRRVTVIRQLAPGGAPAARNRAIDIARGHYLTGIDDDDIWLRSRVAKMVAAASGARAFVCSSDLLLLPLGRRQIATRPETINLQDILCWNVAGNQVLAPADLFRDLGGFDADLTASQDHDLWIRMIIATGKPALGLADILQVVDTSHDEPRITSSARRRSGLWRVYCKHKHHMSRRTRKLHLFNIVRSTLRSCSFRKARALYDRKNRARLALHLLRGRFGNLIDNALAMISSWRAHRRISRIADLAGNMPEISRRQLE